MILNQQGGRKVWRWSDLSRNICNIYILPGAGNLNSPSPAMEYGNVMSKETLWSMSFMWGESTGRWFEDLILRPIIRNSDDSCWWSISSIVLECFVSRLLLIRREDPSLYFDSLHLLQLLIFYIFLFNCHFVDPNCIYCWSKPVEVWLVLNIHQIQLSKLIRRINQFNYSGQDLRQTSVVKT